MIQELKGHARSKRSVAYSSDGEQALIGELMDGIARIWDIKTGKVIKELKGHTAGIYSVAYSPDGEQALTGSMDGTARIWNIKTGEMIQELKGHTISMYLVHSVAYSPDGKQALIGSEDETARIWDLFIIERLSLLQVILLIKLEQLMIKVLEDNYFKQVFDTLPVKLKKYYLEQSNSRSCIKYDVIAE
jgi:WD40 repeat protein